MVFISTFVNLLGLASSLWLGFYIVTRSPRSRVSWLTALTLWSLSCFFLANSIAINAPESDALLWPRFLILFALPLWLHLTLELIAVGTPPSRRIVPTAIVRIGIALSYAFALFLILVGIFVPTFILAMPDAPRLYTSDPGVGPLYALILVFLLVNVVLAGSILYRGRRAALSASLRRQFTLFLIATLLAAAGGWYVAAGTYFDLRLPAFVGDGTLALGITFLGYAVAKYNALIEGRRVEKDFLYAMLAVGSLTLFYVFITLVFYLSHEISFLALVLTIVGSLSFNALYDGVRVALDRLFYRGQFVELRQNLRVFARELGTGQRLNEQLQAALVSFCHALQVKKGMIAIKEDDAFVVRATLDANPIGTSFPSVNLSTNEIIGLVLPERKGLPGMTLLVPLRNATAQVGAVVLGEKEDKEPYSEQELEFLDEVAEMARVIFATRAQEENVAQINALVAEYRERERALQLQLDELVAARTPPAPIAPSVDEEEMADRVEDALRHLHDFAFLGEHSLGNLRVVQSLCQEKGVSISVDRGKIVSDVLHRALEKIRPDGAEPKPHDIPPREWHPYIILRDSYVKDEPNRNILARLYVGEGTFNRTRRRALRIVAQALQEMERGS